MEISQLYDSSKDNLAIEAIEDILAKFLKLNPESIAYSIRRFEELVQDKVFKFRKLGNPKNELIDLFSIQYTQSTKSGNKFNYIKPISNRHDLENKLLWYNVLMLCNQSFKIPGHSKWNEHLISHIDYDQLSIYDSSNLNTIWEVGIQFGMKLGLSFDQRFLLSHIVNWVCLNTNIYSFQNFNIVLDSILYFRNTAIEIADFLSYYSQFIHQYSKSDKHCLNSLIENNPKACVEMMCLTLSKLATLICTSTRDYEERLAQYEVCKKYWFNIFRILLSCMINYYLNTHNPKDFAIVLRCFYDIIRIPTAPEALVKPWIKEHKKEVVLLITKLIHRIDIETFFEFLRRFSRTVHSKVVIFDYFTKYKPAENISLKNPIWQDLLTIIFKIKEPLNAIFHTLEKIFKQYLQRNEGFEFICNCLEFDLPAYGLEYTTADKENKLISNFMRSIERACGYELRLIIHRNLVDILSYIPKLRLPSMLQVVIMDSLCRAIVPEQSLLSHPNKVGSCKELIISLETLSHQKNHTTFEQINTSYEHYYLWRILASIIQGIKFERIVWSNFPYMVTTLMFVFAKYCGNIPGFQEYAWENKNLLSFNEFCKSSYNIISGNYNDILNDECSLIDYTAIQKNLKNLNDLFKSSGLAILNGEDIQTKMYTFDTIAQEMKKTLILELEVEKMEIKSAFLLNFLNDHQTEVPDGITGEIDALFNLCYEQVLKKTENEKYVLIPVLEAKDSIKIREFRLRCANLVDSFEMFSYPISEGCLYSVHQFLAHFRIRENVLFDACLRKCIADEVQQIRREEGKDQHYISMEQFVACTINCYKSLDRICSGNSTYAEIEQINKYLSHKFLDFARIYTDIMMFPPLAARIKGDLKLPNFAPINILITDKINITEKLCTRINVICKEYDPEALIETDDRISSPVFDELTIPNDIYEVLQFLNLLCKVPLPPILLTIARFTIITNVLKIYSELYPCLNIDQAGFFFSHIPISCEIIKLQQNCLKLFQTSPFDKCTDPNLNLFITSCTPMKESVHSIVRKFISRQLLKSQLITLKEKLIIFNNILKLYGEIEPIDINVLNSQISEFEEKQTEIKQLVFFNSEVCTPDNSLLMFMKSFSVHFPSLLDEYVTSVLSTFDSPSTDSSASQLTLDQLTTKCSYIKGELSLLSRDVFEFISFFSTNNNLIFLSLLRQITSHRLRKLSAPSDKHLDIKQFVQCLHETYQHMHSMCIGDSSYTYVQSLFTHYSIRSTDLNNIVENLSKFPKFSLIMRDGFPSLCLFELQAISRYIVSIVELCENFNLQFCMSSFDYQSLKKHSCNLRDIKYCEKVNIPLANQLMRDISQLTSSMTIDRMRLMAKVAKCNEVKLVFNKLNLKNGRTDLELLLTKILSDSKLAEHHLLISTNLLPVYDWLTPLFDENLHFTELMNSYSNLPIDNEEETAVRLGQFRSNINVFRLCFEHVNAF